MRKLFTILVLLTLITGNLSAQEAFKHLGAGIEFGTTGLGVTLSYPVITDKLVVTLGYNFPTYTIKSSFNLNGEPVNARINAANETIDQYNDMVNSYDNLRKDYPFLPENKDLKTLDHIEKIGEVHTDIAAKLNFGNFKAMVEFYPTTKSYFHITAGVLIGNGEWMNIAADVDKKVWDVYQNAIEQNSKIPTMKRGALTEGITSPDPSVKVPVFPSNNIGPISGLEDAVMVNINNDTYHLTPESNGHLETKLTIAKVKPYIGVGFGSSVPTKRRFGFLMEIGAYYQGKPTFESKQIQEFHDPNAFSDKTVDEVVDMLLYLKWYPQITFRFTGKIF